MGEIMNEDRNTVILRIMYYLDTVNVYGGKYRSKGKENLFEGQKLIFFVIHIKFFFPKKNLKQSKTTHRNVDLGAIGCIFEKFVEKERTIF
jgi:hypothetical protein